MKKILFVAVIVIVILYFYVFNGIKFEIINNSGESIYNVKFYTSEKFEVATFDEISSKEKCDDFLNMRKNKIDGEYILEFTQRDKLKKINTGYYTNGGALDEKLIFQVEKDTILVQIK